MFGGAMRQAGILAAAALHALEHHRARLADDHANALRLGELLANTPGLTLAYPVHTNMVFVDLGDSIPEDAAAICARLRAMSVLALPNKPRRIRLVCHLDVQASMIEPTARAFGSVVQAARGVASRAQAPVLA
jgi:threonine aldolase